MTQEWLGVHLFRGTPRHCLGPVLACPLWLKPSCCSPGLFPCCSSAVLLVWWSGLSSVDIFTAGPFLSGCFFLWVDRPLSQLHPPGHEQEGVTGQRSSQACSETPSSGRHKCGGLKSAPNPVKNSETAQFCWTFLGNHPSS